MDAKNGTINEREAALIAEIAKQPGIKKNELAEKMDLSVRTISRILQNSSDALGLIEYSGSKKTGGYMLTDNGQESLKICRLFYYSISDTLFGTVSWHQ